LGEPFDDYGGARATRRSPSRTSAAFTGPTWDRSSEARRTSLSTTWSGSPGPWIWRLASCYRRLKGNDRVFGPAARRVEPATLTRAQRRAGVRTPQFFGYQKKRGCSGRQAIA